MSMSRRVRASRSRPRCEHTHPRRQTANQTGAQLLTPGEPQPQTSATRLASGFWGHLRLKAIT